MTGTLYRTDIVRCEDQLFEDLDALLEDARCNTGVYVGYTDIELVSAQITDEGLEIVYDELDLDDDDREIRVRRTETFDLEFVQMHVLTKTS